MNTMMETHFEDFALIEDVTQHWHIPLPHSQEDSFEELGAQRSAERNRRRQRCLRRAQRATAAALSCTLAR
jgi:hypothetical protein